VALDVDLARARTDLDTFGKEGTQERHRIELVACDLRR
jgi:hypothetical protein